MSRYILHSHETNMCYVNTRYKEHRYLDYFCKLQYKMGFWLPDYMCKISF